MAAHRSTAPTARQKEILDFIVSRVDAVGYAPSVREICQSLGLSSTATVHSHLETLKSKGFLNAQDGLSRSITLTDAAWELYPERGGAEAVGYQVGEVVPIPVIGQVAAGSPTLAEENIEETLALPASLVSGDTFMLRVRGDSMIEVGIFDGDLVIVRVTETASNGDIVVAVLEDEATVKTYYREANRIRLQPENASLDPIYATDVRIAGRVVGLLRIGL